MATTKLQIEPLIGLKLRSLTGNFHPGDVVECEYQVDAVEPSEVHAIEASVMWYTEGKGEEDLGVHHFERSRPGDAIDGDIRQLQLIRTVLPPSPLSYQGAILKICWCIRIRLFWGRGKETHIDRHFQLLPAPNAGVKHRSNDE